jgi:exonuclease SbcC
MGELNGILSDVENKLAGMIECPECSATFSLEAEETHDELEDTKRSLLKDIKEMEDYIEKRQEVIDLIEAGVEKLREKGNAINSKTVELSREVNKVDALVTKQSTVLSSQKRQYDGVVEEQKRALQKVSSQETKLKTINSDLESLTEERKNIEEREFTSDTVSMKESIAKAKKVIKKLEKEDKQYVDEIQEYNEWDERFKEFYTEITNEFIKSIESRVNSHLRAMKSELSVSISGFRYTQAGKLRDDITATIYKGGVESGIFHKHSEGEKARINISTLMAIQDIINSSSPTGGVDLMFLDEIMEGVDSHGIKLIMEAIDSIDRTIVNITHITNEEVRFNNECIVHYDGESRIEMNYN